MIDIKRIIVQEILMRATALKDTYTTERGATAAWVCIFSQSDDEYDELMAEANKIGEVYKDMPNGIIFRLNETLGRTVKILKVRKPDPNRPERGDADFTVSDYASFKEQYKDKKKFKLIPRDGFEMIELMEHSTTVRVYFSNPPIEEEYKDII